MKEFVAIVEQLGSMEKVRTNMIQHSCNCNNELTDILLENISKDLYKELRYKQLKENVMQDVKKELYLSFRQRLSNIELHF